MVLQERQSGDSVKLGGAKGRGAESLREAEGVCNSVYSIYMFGLCAPFPFLALCDHCLHEPRDILLR